MLPKRGATQPLGFAHIKTKWFWELTVDFVEHAVRRDQHRIHAREYAGDEPSIVLMHGFPDNLHLYDRLVPYLSPCRIVTFDFLGWGASEKPLGYPYTAENQEGDLDAVIKQRRGRRKRKKASGLESRQTWALGVFGALGGPGSGRVKPFSSTRMCMGWTGQRLGLTRKAMVMGSKRVGVSWPHWW